MYSSSSSFIESENDKIMLFQNEIAPNFSACRALSLLVVC